MNKLIEKIFSSIGFTLFLLILAIALLVISLFHNTNDGKQDNEDNFCSNNAIDYPECVSCEEGQTLVNSECINTIIEDKKELTDYEKYQSYKKVSIYSNGLETPSDYMKNYSKYLEDDGANGVGKRIEVRGEIEDAYIYIKAGATDIEGSFGPILKDFDTIYFYIKNGRYIGGHLDLSKSKYGKTSDLTELLFNLKNLSFASDLKSEYRKNIFHTENFLVDLNDGKLIGAIVNTQRYGKIENLIIAYKCKGNKNDCEIK